MVERVGVKLGSENSKVVQACTQFNLFEPGTKIVECFLNNNGRVGAREVQGLLDRAAGKKRDSTSDMILEKCWAHGLKVLRQGFRNGRHRVI